MKYKSPGKHRSVEAFREHFRSLAPELDCDDEILAPDGPLQCPIEVDGHVLANRFVTHPMEGWDGTADGRPTDLTRRRWRNFGRSGAKLIWGGEAFAVQEDGRANPHQLYRNPSVDIVGDLTALRHEIREGHAEIGESPEELWMGLQLTHSGRYACPDGKPAPMAAVANPTLDARMKDKAEVQVASDLELGDIVESYVASARLARDAGFDFVDVKCCHGYLLHEMLGARERPGPYGGSLENRMRLFREIVERIRTDCPGLAIAVRISISDILPHSADAASGIGTPARDVDAYGPHSFGLHAGDDELPDLTEPIEVLSAIQELGIQLVNITIGSPYYCPHVQRPAAYPPSDGYQPPEDPLASVIRHLRVVRACKERFSELVMVGSGYSYLQEYLPHVAQQQIQKGYVDMVGLGRMLLVYPDMIRDILRGEPLERTRICRTFSECTTAARHGLPSGCYPLDPHYKAMPEAQAVDEIQKKNRAADKNRKKGQDVRS